MTTRPETPHRASWLAVVAALTLGAAAAGTAGCREVPPAPPIRDVRPTTLERGDTLLLELGGGGRHGGRLSAGTEVAVKLSGTITPVNGRPVDGGLSFTGRAVGSAGSAQATRILAVIDEPQERAVGGHARFVGRVEITPAEGRGAVLRSAPVELDLFPRTLRRAADGAWNGTELRRVTSWLGATVQPGPQGLAVTTVTPGSPAALARLEAGNVIQQIDGQPATQGRLAARLQRRGTVTLAVKPNATAGSTVPLRVAAGGAPRPFWGWVIAALILWGTSLVIVLLVAVGGGFITVWERKVAGRMQSRIGPNRVGPQGWLQWLADALKLITKEDLIPADADRPLFLTSPYLVFCGVFMTFMVLPFSQLLVVADLNIGFLYLLAVTSLVVVGVIMGGWASNSKWSLIGGMRSAAQIISYELPAGLALMVIAVMAGTLSPQEIIRQQGGAPWSWYVFHNPAALCAFFIYFIAALAEGNRTPFDLPEAESELVSGYNTEYSGFRFGAFATAEWVNLWVIGALATALFLGGWRIPRLAPEPIEASVWLQLASFAVFFGKAAALVFVTIWLRWTLPRFRIDQMMSMCWKYLVPFGLVCLVGSMAWMWGFQGHAQAQRIASIVLFVGGGLVPFVYFWSRVRYTYRVTNGQLDLNLFK
ncbi:MAG: NADH-quinone oxidoreductase subunit NuoH [Deltaproteobacteria bacterium]|nr:NADH-quinone oxidoreductase subunit NuoH [Deltaproteobacteria bacterium]